jgi:Uma2 family endonuclease
MPSTATRVSPEEYLERERAAEFKSEYRDGVIVAMSGASFRHGVIVTNLVIEAGSQLRKRPCRVISTDLKVAVRAANLITYPDVVVVCGPPVFAYDRQDVLRNPIVLIEVLSKSTAKYDRGEKFAAYRTIPSLKEYLTVAQDKIHVEQYVRQPDEQWPLTQFNDMQETIRLESISVDLRVAEIYENIELGES